jgi:hypothetical protein
MVKWLAVAAGLPLVMATAAHAQMKGLAPVDLAGVARNHFLDLRISQQQGGGPQPLIRGMVVQRDVAANAFVGVGLANMYGRRKSDNSVRITDPPARSRKPAVTFVLKF